MLAWNGNAHRKLDVEDALAKHPGIRATPDEARALLALGSAYTSTGLTCMNSTPLFHALLRPLAAELPAWGELDADGLAHAIETTESAQALPGDGALARQIRQAARLTRHGAWRLARRHDQPAPEADALRRDLEETISAQRETWLATSRPGGLDDSVARLERSLGDY